ncbi:CHASE2 domain-containing protein [Nautilia sp.]
MKKYHFFLGAVLLLLSVFSVVYLKNPPLPEIIDKKIKDSFFTLRGDVKPSEMITIVNIDEKSLSAFGQWPWNRRIIARIVRNLTAANAGIIGYDIFFAEPDAKGEINDMIMADALKNSPSVLGIMFDFEKNITKNTLPNIPAVFIQKNFTKEFLPVAKGYLANITVLQNSAYSSGFVNMIPDSDGAVRYIPLIIKYKDDFYPSLAFEMFRLAIGVSKITVNYTPNGIKSVTLDKNLTVPTDRFGRLFINYRGKKGKYAYLSAKDVYDNRFDKNKVSGRFIIIGTTSAGLFDLRATPFESAYPGVEIHATILDNLLQNDIIHAPQNEELIDLFIMFLLSSLTAFVIYRFSALYAFLAVMALIGGTYYLDYYLFFNKHVILNTVYPAILSALTALVLITVNYMFEHKKTLLIKRAFAKKVSPKVMEELLKNPGDILAPKEREITVYFSDIRGFTTISEKISDPIKLIKMLNSYFTPVSNLIIKYKGTIDKFIGDAVMAYWNAPNECENHADMAVECAIEHINLLKKLNKKIKRAFGVNIDIGIGINTGMTTIGEMGSEGRSDYTVIGDSVNLASRLEGLNKYYGTHILISEYTKKLLKKHFNTREIDTVLVKGKNRPVTIYEVTANPCENIEKYEKALDLYKTKNLEKALKIFSELYAEKNDKIYKIYIERCMFFIKHPEKFSAVHKFETK